MDEYKYLLDIAVILISTKLLGMLTRRIQLPQVVGALLAGLLLGSACFGIITEGALLSSIAEIGVIVLMFCAGLETNIEDLKRSGLSAFIIALLGVLVPLAGGYAAAALFNTGWDTQTVLQNIFVGVVLTATSVSITVETLKELGKLSTRSGNAILGAALIDDLLGIIGLTIITGFADPSVRISVSLLQILGFILFCGLVALLSYKLLIPWINSYQKDLRRFGIIAFTMCLLMAYAAEHFFGVSDITGAFVAGLILSGTKKTPFLLNKFDALSFMLLSPVFFASVGLKVHVDHLSLQLVEISLVLIAVAVLSKMIGCFIGAKLCGYTNLQATKICIGMISRGEVALIVATKGIALGLMPDAFFAPIIIMVVATTMIAPIMLKIVYRYQAAAESHIESALVDRHEEKYELEHLTQTAFNKHADMKEHFKKQK